MNVRRKGAEGERETAELLQKWWSRLEPGCIFKRTPLSGGWASPEARAGFKTSGDVITTAERWPWCVEIKRREGWSFDSLIAGHARSPVYGWWEQARTAAREIGAAPLLLFRQSRQPWYALTPCEGNRLATAAQSLGAFPVRCSAYMTIASVLFESDPEIWAKEK